MRETRILPRRKGYLLLCVLGCLFVFFVKTEKDLAANGNVLWTAGYVGSTLAWSVILGCVLGIVGTRVVYHIAENTAARQNSQTQSQDNMDGADGRQKAIGYKRFADWIQNRSGGQVLLGSLLLLLLAWLPVYLAYYPGICAYDAPVQTGQIMEHYYFDHHPIVHTLLLQGMLWLGSHIFGSVNAGMACYTAAQMLLLAGSMAYGMWVLHRRKAPVAAWLSVLLLGMFFPFHWYMSVSMTCLLYTSPSPRD